MGTFEPIQVTIHEAASTGLVHIPCFQHNMVHIDTRRVMTQMGALTTILDVKPRISCPLSSQARNNNTNVILSALKSDLGSAVVRRRVIRHNTAGVISGRLHNVLSHLRIHDVV